MNARRFATILTWSAATVVVPVPVAVVVPGPAAGQDLVPAAGQDLAPAAGQDPMPPAAGKSSIVLADRSFFPTPAPVLPDHPFSPAFQVEESEPGSFGLGAFVGLLVFVGINSQIADQGDGQPAFFLFPMCVIGGAMIFWSAGIG